jgi:uncharacterized membrane protein
MEEVFKEVAGYIALAVEASAALIIAFGAMQALYGSFRAVVEKRSVGQRKEVWLEFGVWLLLGLEFELAADIVRSAISPTWVDIGQLAAIGVIRTFLNFFLEKDLDKYESKEAETEKLTAKSVAA